MRTTTLFLVLALALTACGKDEPADRTPARELAKAPAAFLETVSALAPADAQVVVQFSSGSRLAEVLGAMAGAFDAPAPGDPLAEMTAQMGIDAAQVDRSKPFAMAVSLDKQAPMPMPTFILPYADPAAAAAAHQGGSATRDGYAALSMTPEAKPGGSTLAGGLLAGDVSVRVDLGAIVGMYRAEIDQGIGMATAVMQEGFAQGSAPDAPLDMAKMMQGYLDAYVSVARKLVDSAETLDLTAARRDDGTIDIEAAFTVRAGSPLDASGKEKPSLEALGRYLPGDLPIVVLVRFDWSSYMEMMRGMMDAVIEAAPEEQRASFRSLMDKSMSMMDGLGSEWAMGFDFAPDGFRGAMAVNADDAEAYIQRYLGLLGDPGLAEMGMKFESLGTREVGGVTAHRARMAFDMEKYLALFGMAGEPGMPGTEEMEAAMKAVLGEEGIVFEMAAVENQVVFSFGGGDGLLAKALAGDTAPAGLGPALARVGGDVNFAFYADMRALMRGIAGMVRSMDESVPEVPAGGPLPISMACGSDGRVHRFGMSFDLEELAAFFKALD